MAPGAVPPAAKRRRPPPPCSRALLWPGMEQAAGPPGGAAAFGQAQGLGQTKGRGAWGAPPFAGATRPPPAPPGALSLPAAPREGKPVGDYAVGRKGLHLEVYAGVPLEIRSEFVVLAGQDGVEEDAGQGGDRQAGQADGGGAHLEGHGSSGAEGDADGTAPGSGRR